MSLLADKRILITTTTLQQTFGGRTKSLLQRARIFAKHGLHVTVYAMNFNENYQDTFALYREKGHITPDIQIGDLFETLGGWSADIQNNYRTILQDVFGDLTKYEKREFEDKDKYFLDGHVVLGINYTTPDKLTLKSIDAFELERKQPVRRYVVNKRGNVRRIRNYKAGGWELDFEDYLDIDGNVIARMRQIDGNKQMQHVKLGDGKTWTNNKEFIATFLNSFVQDNDIIINDARGLDYSIRLVERNVPKIYVMHNPHLADPLDLNSGIKNSFKSIIRPDLAENERIVALTTDQRDNILQYVPELADKIAVIGHAVPQKTFVPRSDEPQKAVGIIGRISEQKNLGDAIKAFEIFHKEHPGYRLDIYGKGDQEEEMKALVQKLNLNEAVNFLGFTEDVNAAYRSVDFTLNTSFYEGFPLAIIESIGNGTPVISYPVNFGPETILNYESGKISSERTPKSLSLAMNEEIENPLSHKKVYKRSTEFNVHDFYNSWHTLLIGG